MTADEFEERYRPISEVWDNGPLPFEEAKGWPTDRVWTVVDGESGRQYVQAGFHIVNVVGYVVTENPWSVGTEEAEWFNPEDYK